MNESNGTDQGNDPVGSQLARELRSLTDGAAGRPPDVGAVQGGVRRVRRRRIAVGAAMAGILGVAVAGMAITQLTTGAHDGTVAVSPETGAAASESTAQGPRTVGEMCDGSSVKFSASTSGSVKKHRGPRDAVRPWVRSEQAIVETSIADDRERLIAVGASDQAPVAVYRVKESVGGWYLRETYACLGMSTASDGCGFAIEALGGGRFMEKPPDPRARVGVGGFWRYGQLPACSVVDGRGSVRGVVAPISIFYYPDADPSYRVTVTVDGEVREFKPINR